MRVPPRIPTDLAAQMRRLLAEAELARRLGGMRTSAGRGGVSWEPRRWSRYRAVLRARPWYGHYKVGPPADPVIGRIRVARMERRL